MKKIISIFFICCFAFACMVPSFAAGVFDVYSDSIETLPGETIYVPIKISGNKGIMGFRITVKYDNRAFDCPIVERGTVTSTGNFNDSITNKTNGALDVVWSDTENVSDDGVLFYVKLNVKESTVSGTYNIQLSYNQSDTFNEKWEDVKLNCGTITINIPSSDNDDTVGFFAQIWNIILHIWNWLVDMVR